MPIDPTRLFRLVPAHQARDFVRAHPRKSAAAGVLVFAVGLTGASLAGTGDARPAPIAAAPAAITEMTPFAVRKVGAGEAQKLNAAVPLASGPNPAASPFVLKADTATYARALECLAQAIYYEAALEPEEGQRAVAQVVLNRMRHPAYPASVCGVVYQGSERHTGCQFSFTCDGSLARAPMRVYWEQARRLAHQALQGHVAAAVGNATHYHADYVAPYWAPTLVKNAVIGAHIFYRWPGGWGRPAAFTQRWSRRESDPHLLRRAALAAEARHDAAEPLLAEAGGEEAVVEAKKALPPEFAEQLMVKTGPQGEARVAMTIKVAEREAAGTRASLQQLDKAMSGSSSLNWALTGKAESQAPLGSKSGSDSSSEGGAAAAVAAAGGLAGGE